MTIVYFKPITLLDGEDQVSKAVLDLIHSFKQDIPDFVFEKDVKLKVHFGEHGNRTFIRPSCYYDLITYLQDEHCTPTYIETNVLYRGQRTKRKDHEALAKRHGFIQLPIEIADGEHGEAYREVAIKGVHYHSCKIGEKIADAKQLIVCSHFKGHMLAGFGGAIKQLAMGCASRGGKLAMHGNSKPILNPITCKQCGVCVAHCPVDAIDIGFFSKIKYDVCIGCASCIAVCPYGVIKINWMGNLANPFQEKLAEYALAATKDKSNIYITFALSMTKNCDCDGKLMKPITDDLGVFLSTDPVAIDKAVHDMLDKREGKRVFGGRHVLIHAEKIGLGTQEYELKNV